MFKKEHFELPEFKDGRFYIKELSIAQTQKLMAFEGDDIDMMLYSLEFCFFYANGNKVITDDYTIDNLKDDLPQSYMNKIADAMAKLNTDDKKLAKKS